MRAYERVSCRIASHGCEERYREAVGDLAGVDPVVFGGAALALLGAALAASWLPARQATKISPLVALRTE